MAGRHRITRRQAAKYPPADRRTSADIVWQITKELQANGVCTREYLIGKFKPSPGKYRLAINWLRKKGHAVENGAMIALTDQGRAFHDARKGILNEPSDPMGGTQ